MAKRSRVENAIAGISKTKTFIKFANAMDGVMRKNVEAPHWVAVDRRSQVLIEPPIMEKPDVYRVRFVVPRLVSPLNPLYDHVIAIAIQTAVHQAITSSLKRFGGLEELSSPYPGLINSK